MTVRIFAAIAVCVAWIDAACADAGDRREREWRHVRDVLFTALDDSTYEGNRVTRWDEQPVIILIGAKDEDRALVNRAIEKWNPLLHDFPMRIEEIDRGDVNVGILFASRQNMPAMAARHGMQADIARRGTGYTEMSVRPDHAAQISVTLIQDELEGDERHATIVHELYHALGPSGHSSVYPGSIIFQGETQNSTALGLSAIDAKVLALLYGYLSPGDTEEDVRAAFDRHWDALDSVVAGQ